jgi:hypothetical protein
MTSSQRRTWRSDLAKSHKASSGQSAPCRACRGLSCASGWRLVVDTGQGPNDRFISAY